MLLAPQSRVMRLGKTNRWKGALLGAVGGVVGTLVLDGYFKALKAITGRDLEKAKNPRQGPLGDIALVDSQMERGETANAAVGRIAYDNLMGREPRSEETRDLLAQLVHWGYGTGQGILYGAIRKREKAPDLAGGGVFGTALWGFSAVGLPLLGLGKGPTAQPPEHHAASFAGHLLYGVTVASVTQLLRRWI